MVVSELWRLIIYISAVIELLLQIWEIFLVKLFFFERFPPGLYIDVMSPRKIKVTITNINCILVYFLAVLHIIKLVFNKIQLRCDIGENK